MMETAKTTMKKTAEKVQEVPGVKKAAEKVQEIPGMKKAAEMMQEMPGVKKVQEVDVLTPIKNTARTIVLAGLGAVALGKEEIETVLERLIEKGEVAEKDGRKMVNDLFERRKKDVTEAEGKVESMFDKRFEGILNRINMPSKGDIDSLNRKVGSLARKVEDLTTKLAA